MNWGSPLDCLLLCHQSLDWVVTGAGTVLEERVICESGDGGSEGGRGGNSENMRRWNGVNWSYVSGGRSGGDGGDGDCGAIGVHVLCGRKCVKKNERKSVCEIGEGVRLNSDDVVCPCESCDQHYTPSFRLEERRGQDQTGAEGGTTVSRERHFYVSVSLRKVLALKQQMKWEPGGY